MNKMIKRIYKSKNYKEFILEKIAERSQTRGYQVELAKIAGCKPSYFNGVLNSSLHLTPVHVMRLAKYWKLDFAESDCFLNLLLISKSKDPHLYKHLEMRLSMKESLPDFSIINPLDSKKID